MVNIIGSALQGMNVQTNKLANAAHNIANSGDKGVNIEDLIDITEAEMAYKANVQLIPRAREMHNDLLRIFDKEV
ncbi:MAG: hypothetical protein CMH28_03275 [Micavibrio sp.]|nr:hypothetical protein [Micavibrio sp.]|tara:strand:- start:80 stop:304 length:225 start_codon:yes stop_codon:yes gene_type:complete